MCFIHHDKQIINKKSFFFLALLIFKLPMKFNLSYFLTHSARDFLDPFLTLSYFYLGGGGRTSRAFMGSIW